MAYLGDPPKTPDQIHEENLLADGLDQAVRAMANEDQELISQIFDFILSQQSFPNQADLIESIAIILRTIYVTNWNFRSVNQNFVFSSRLSSGIDPAMVINPEIRPKSFQISIYFFLIFFRNLFRQLV